MDFRDLARKESSAFIDRVAAAAEDVANKALAQASLETDKVRKQLQKAQAQFEAEKARAAALEADLDSTVEAHHQVDAARAAAEDALAEAVAAHAESMAAHADAMAANTRLHDELAAAREMISRAHAEATRLNESLEAEIAQKALAQEDAAAAHEAVERERARFTADINSLHAQLEAAAADAERLRTELATARGDADTLRRDLDTARADADLLRSDLEIARADADTIRGEKAAAHAEIDTLRAERNAGQAQIDSLVFDLDAAHREAQRAQADIAGLRTQLDTSRAEADALRSEGEALRLRAEATRADVEAVRAEAEALRVQRAVAQKETDVVRAERSNALAEIDALRTERNRALSEIESLRAGRTSVNAEFEAIRAECERAFAEVDAMRAERDRAYAEIDSARGERTTLFAEVETVRSDLAKARLAVHRAEGAATTMLAASVRAVHALGSAATLEDLFGTLVQELRPHLPRVVLFRVKGNHLEGERGAGLEASMDITKLSLPVSLDSLVTRAMSAGTLVRADQAQLDTTAPPIGGTAVAAIAVPLVFGDEPFAVLYGDSPSPMSDPQIAVVDLLVRNAALILSRLGQEIRMLSEMREYASMLIAEAEQMFQADVEAGRPEAERVRRLQTSIECARQLYSQRAELEGVGATALLEQQLASVLSQRSAFADALSAAIEQADRARTA